MPTAEDVFEGRADRVRLLIKEVFHVFVLQNVQNQVITRTRHRQSEMARRTAIPDVVLQNVQSQVDRKRVA